MSAAANIHSTHPVTLNLFQGPSGLVFRRWGGKSDGTVTPFNKASARAAKWILNQVQDDDNGKGGPVSRVEFVR